MLECIFGGFLIIVVFAIFVCLIVAFSGEGAEKTSKTYLEIQNKMLQISQKVFSKKVGLQTKLDELDIIEIALDFDELPVKQEDATDLDSCSVEDLADFAAAEQMAYLKYQTEIRKDSLEKTETRSFHNFVTDFMSSGRGDLEEGIRFINFYFSKITTERNAPRLKLNIEITKKCWNSSYLQECCVYFSGKKLRFNVEEIRLSDMKTALSTVITKEQLGQMANSTDVVVRLMNTTDYVDAKLSAQNISFLKQFYEEEVLGNKPNETLQQK
ncbi:MAG: hypothetical protein PUK74_02115 [Elusimicrobia bacterium]|nr:hypothetical protein [Elusimicrobiota bacterium]MDY5728628.1 hypothetical protein [Elusimicrobiaceae bacterium]